MKISEMCCGPLEDLWAERAQRVAEFWRRVDPRGMTRPQRDPAEREWLEERGRLGPFVEVERPTL